MAESPAAPEALRREVQLVLDGRKSREDLEAWLDLEELRDKGQWRIHPYPNTSVHAYVEAMREGKPLEKYDSGPVKRAAEVYWAWYRKVRQQFRDAEGLLKRAERAGTVDVDEVLDLIRRLAKAYGGNAQIVWWPKISDDATRSNVIKVAEGLIARFEGPEYDESSQED